MKHRKRPIYRRRTICTVLVMLILLAVAIVLICQRCGEDRAAAVAEATPPPEPIHVLTYENEEIHEIADDEPVSPLSSEDVTLLAKIMQEEDGHEWPDWAIMAIGEVVLNRVASVEFPDTIEAVLMQENPEQYAPVHSTRWENFEPGERYVELAERLLGGERVLNNPQIVYQALFEQGRGTVLTYKDLALGSTTYFCLTDCPELYE